MAESATATNQANNRQHRLTTAKATGIASHPQVEARSLTKRGYVINPRALRVVCDVQIC